MQTTQGGVGKKCSPVERSKRAAYALRFVRGADLLLVAVAQSHVAVDRTCGMQEGTNGVAGISVPIAVYERLLGPEGICSVVSAD